MKVLLAKGDHTGCGHYRCVLPAAFSSVDAEVTTILPLMMRRDHTRGLIFDGDLDCDVVVLQRPVRDYLADVIPYLQAKGVAVVVELDDDLARLDPSNTAHGAYSPKVAHTNWHHLVRAARMADLVTVTTPALAERYGRHGRVAVLPNYVPRALCEMTCETDRGVVGWAGHVQTHPRDLASVNGGVASALSITGARFRHIGAGDAAKALGLRQCENTGAVNMGRYFEEMGRLDVGIVALADTQFNHGKSALKGLELAARGVPFVASPMPDYQRLAADGIGVLARKAKFWSREISRLVSDRAYRDEMSQRARERVIEAHTYETNGWRWAEAWEQAIANRRSASAKRLPASLQRGAVVPA